MVMVPLPEDRAEWLRLRLGYIGASESAALLGPDFAAAYQLSPFALYHIKKGTVAAPDIDNERTRWGLRLERVIAEGVCEQEGWTLLPGRFAVDDDGVRMAASLDFLVDPSERDEDAGYVGLGVLEIKNVDGIQHWKKWDGNEPPPHILVQLQHQLACSGCRWGAVGALIGGNRLAVHRYHRHEGLIASIRQAVADFWRQVERGIAPEVDGSDSSMYAVRQLFGEPVGDEPADLSADNELPGLCADERQLAATVKRLNGDLEGLRNRIRLKIAEHRYATCAGFRISRSVSPDVPDRVAEPGEVIKGRRGADRLTVTPEKKKEPAVRSKQREAA